MKCPYCKGMESRVTDSRAIEDARVIRRRRECTDCQMRFTTMEKVEEEPVMVIKRDGRREVWDGNKILTGLLRATEKRGVNFSVLQDLVQQVEQEARSLYQREIPADRIGDLVLYRLLSIDEVAYVRFASVFRKFQDIDSFKRELEKMYERKDEEETS